MHFLSLCQHQIHEQQQPLFGTRQQKTKDAPLPLFTKVIDLNDGPHITPDIDSSLTRNMATR